MNQDDHNGREIRTKEFPQGKWRQGRPVRVFRKTKIARFSPVLLTAGLIGLLFVLNSAAQKPTWSNKWKITSIKVCRDNRGYLYDHFEVLGSYPVYSFFVPRPVWTVNGRVVEARPVHEGGRHVSFKLVGAVRLLKSGAKNTVKFSLPDQYAAKTFYYDQNKAATGECFEFF
jgi:hypothetical protein